MLTSSGRAGLLFRATNADYSGPDASQGPAGHVAHVRVVLRGAVIAVTMDDMASPTLRTSDGFFLRGQFGARAHNGNAEFRHIRYQG